MYQEEWETGNRKGSMLVAKQVFQLIIQPVIYGKVTLINSLLLFIGEKIFGGWLRSLGKLQVIIPTQGMQGQDGGSGSRSIARGRNNDLFTKQIGQPLQPLGRFGEPSAGINIGYRANGFFNGLRYLVQSVVDAFYNGPHKMGLRMPGLYTEKYAFGSCIPNGRPLTLYIR